MEREKAAAQFTWGTKQEQPKYAHFKTQPTEEQVRQATKALYGTALGSSPPV